MSVLCFFFIVIALSTIAIVVVLAKVVASCLLFYIAFDIFIAFPTFSIGLKVLAKEKVTENFRL